MPVITKARDVASFNLVKCYRMGVVTGLSKLEIATKYSDTCSINALGTTGLYYMVSNYYPKPASPVNKLGEIDTTSTVQTINTSAFADIEDDTDDYPDSDCAEEPTGEIKENEE